MLLFAAVAALGFSSQVLAGHKPTTPTEIANFALNLECLEASFYSYAAFGKGLSDEDFGGEESGNVIGGRKANLSKYAQAYAEEIANDEIAHVRVLRSILGDDAVMCPKMDIGPAFAAAANAAAMTKPGAPLSPVFDPYANDIFFLHGAFIFEDVGVTAYLGAIEALKGSDLVVGAANIAAVEAYHAGLVRQRLADLAYPGTCEYKPRSSKRSAKAYSYNVKKGTKLPYGITVAQIVELISNLRDTADGKPGNNDEGIVKNGKLNVVPVDDATGLAYTRTAAEVLAIVYLTGDPEVPGGFFPEGTRVYEEPAK